MKLNRKLALVFLATLVICSFCGCSKKSETNTSTEKIDSKGDTHNNKDVINEINIQSESK